MVFDKDLFRWKISLKFKVKVLKGTLNLIKT
jgi:hypothetical protein